MVWINSISNPNTEAIYLLSLILIQRCPPCASCSESSLFIWGTNSNRWDLRVNRNVRCSTYPNVGELHPILSTHQAPNMGKSRHWLCRNATIRRGLTTTRPGCAAAFFPFSFLHLPNSEYLICLHRRLYQQKTSRKSNLQSTMPKTRSNMLVLVESIMPIPIQMTGHMRACREP